jgi:hypothetical protein
MYADAFPFGPAAVDPHQQEWPGTYSEQTEPQHPVCDSSFDDNNKDKRCKHRPTPLNVASPSYPHLNAYVQLNSAPIHPNYSISSDIFPSLLLTENDFSTDAPTTQTQDDPPPFQVAQFNEDQTFTSPDMDHTSALCPSVSAPLLLDHHSYFEQFLGV